MRFRIPVGGEISVLKRFHGNAVGDIDFYNHVIGRQLARAGQDLKRTE